MGQTKEAADACGRALAVKPDSAQTLALLGEICADQGDFSAAEEQFRRALSIDPDLPEAWAGLARYRKMSNTDIPWRESVQRLLRKNLTLHHKLVLRFALGKYFDDVREYDSAFENYRLANELSKSKGVKYDPQRFARQIDRIMILYDAEWLRRARTEANPSRRAVFVMGSPRAGTTLGEQILASHPDAAGVGELRFWHAAAVQCETSWPDGVFEEGAIAGMSDHYLRHVAGLSPDALRTIDKMPANFMNLGLIKGALPNASVIHMRRDPRDTALSIYFQNFSATHSYANDLQDIAHYYSQYVRIMAHWRSLLPEDAILDISYEALVRDPEPQCKKMLDFAGLPWDPRCLDFHLTNRTVTTASNWQVRQRVNEDSVGRWRNYQEFVGPLRELAG
jgi:tetratricopeptide (TPR) repeat protein